MIESPGGQVKLPKIEDYKAPWENPEGGDDQEIDKQKLKKYLHGVLSDKERLQETVTTVTTERDTLKTAADEATRQGETEADRLKRENEELKRGLAAAGETSIETLKLEVALDKGLTAIQAKRLLGKTKEELEVDADALMESFGGQGKEDDETPTLRRTPRRLVNPGDPDPDKGKELSGEDVDKLIPRSNSF